MFCSSARVFPRWQHSTIIATIVLVTWLFLNIGLNFFNKEVFSERVGFTFPLFFTMFHMVSQYQPSHQGPMEYNGPAGCDRGCRPSSKPPSEPTCF